MGRPQPGARRPETGSQPRCGGRRDHHAAPTLVVTRTGSPPRTRSRARNNRPGTISLASERLTADAIRAHGGLRRGGLGRAAAALEVVLDDGLPAERSERDAAIADAYRLYLDTALAEPAVATVITFGLSDRYTWLQEDYPRDDGEPRRPLPFDDKLQPKHAYDALASALAEAIDREPLWHIPRQG